jgi:Ser/Thr protein kinase RdoA (MazF antagonist)
LSLSHFPDPDMPDYSDVRLREDARTVPDEVLDLYDLSGSSVVALETGSYNIHFRIESGGKTFDLRKSNRPSAPGNLDYEAEILIHLKSRGFDLAPEIVPSTQGDSNVWIDDTGWTLFRWMGDGPTGAATGSIAKARAAARVLVDIHALGEGFSPTAMRGNWPIFTLPNVDPDSWLRRAESLAEHLDGEGEDLREMARESAQELRSINFNELPEFTCHADYRVRNLQFSGDEVTGVFDFDTSVRSTRLLDLAGAVTRFSPLGGDPQADVESGSEFLKTYHDRLPLAPAEIDALPALIRWRLLRDVVIYYDRWWFKVGDTQTALHSGAADEIVTRAIPF